IPPFTYLHEVNSSWLMDRGIEYQFLHLMSGHFNFTYRLIRCYAMGAKQANNTWTGLLGLINQTMADIALGGISLTDERSDAAHFSQPHIQTGCIDSDVRDNFMDIKWLVVNTALRQQCPVCIPHRLRLLMVFWLLATLVLTSSYSGCLYSLMAFPTRTKTINTVEELATAQSQHTIQVMATKNGAYYNMIMKSNTGVGMELKKGLKGVSNTIAGINMIAKSDKQLAQISFREALIYNMYKSGATRLHIPPDTDESTLFMDLLTVGFRKDFPYKNEINKFISGVKKSGLMDFWKVSEMRRIISGVKKSGLMDFWKIPPFVYLREVNGTWIMNRGIEAELLHLMSRMELKRYTRSLTCCYVPDLRSPINEIVLRQNSSLPLIPGSLRPVFTGWLWACLVLTSSYSGCLYSLMSFPTRVKTINTVEELAEAQREHRVRVIATTSDAYYEADIGLSGISVTEQRREVSEFTESHFITALFAIIISIYLIQHVRYDGCKISIKWTVVEIVLRQNSSLPLIPGSLRPVFTGWLWACLVLTSSYSGCLYSLMSFPTRVKTINTVEELAEAQREHRVRVIATTSDAYYDMIRNSKTGLGQYLASDLIGSETDGKAVDAVKTSDKELAFITFREALQYEMLKSGADSFYIPPESEDSVLFRDILAVPMRKDFEHKIAVNRFIASVKKSGFIDYWRAVEMRQISIDFNAIHTYIDMNSNVNQDNHNFIPIYLSQLNSAIFAFMIDCVQQNILKKK
ncbi:unnamed protein product, partial [Medioppia subpectinata]